MKKIPSLFKRDWEKDSSLITKEVNPECLWVIEGKGTPTEKLDGTACLIKDGMLYKRYDRKKYAKGVNKGKYKQSPNGWFPCQEPDEITGHWPGWLPVDFSDPNNKWHKEAWEKCQNPRDGTYELIGPKIEKNPYNLAFHKLIEHGSIILDCNARDYESLKSFLSNNLIEGIVWHGPDGKMAKIKRTDFGFTWPV